MNERGRERGKPGTDREARSGAAGPAPPPGRDRRPPGTPRPLRTPPSCDLSCAGNRGRDSRGARCRLGLCLQIQAGFCRPSGQGSGGLGEHPARIPRAEGNGAGPDCAPGPGQPPTSMSRWPRGSSAGPHSVHPWPGTPRTDPGHGWGLLLGLPRGPQHRAALRALGYPGQSGEGGGVPGGSSAPLGPLPASRRAPALPGPP